jgi:uncharacterized protein YlxP (DUF503 family)
MPIGLLTLDIHLPESHSLKDKRQVLRSLKDRLRGKFNVAVAELEHSEILTRATIGVVTLGDQPGFVEQSLQAVLAESESQLGRYLVDHQIELY